MLLLRVPALLVAVGLGVVAPPSSAGTASAAVDRGSATSYKLEKVAGSVVRWNPCEPVHYRVDTDAAPAGALADTQVAVARVAQETGLTFVYDGPTSAVPTEKGPRPAGITVAWAKRGSGRGSSDLLPGGSTLGVGGWDVAYAIADRGGAISDVHIVDGYVVLDTRSNTLPGGFADRKGGTRGELLEHELGHAVGLAHVSDKSQVMYPKLGSHTSFGAGDKAGLRKVGKAAGCTT